MDTQNKQKKKKECFLKYFVYDFVKVTGILPMLLWLRPKYVYENKEAKKKIKGRAIFIANHNSMFDPVVMHCAVWYRRMYTVAMQELFELNKVAKWFFTKILCIPINRENVNIGNFKEIIKTLKEDKAVGVFPEGHINIKKDEGIDFFKSGVVLMAFKSKAPIIPMVFLKRKKWWHRQIVVVGEAIDVYKENMTLNDIAETSEILYKKEQQLLEINNKKD